MSIAPQLRANTTVRFDYCNGIGSGGCTDIDGLYERRGNFLVLENKLPNERISQGQMITLRALAKLPQFTVLVVRGHPPDRIVSYGVLDGEQKPANVIELRNAIQTWWNRQRA